MKKHILVADDINHFKDKSKAVRSLSIMQTSMNFANRLHENVDLLYVEDLSNLTSLKNLHLADKVHVTNVSKLQTIKRHNKNLKTHLRSGSAPVEIVNFINRAPNFDFAVVGTADKKGLEKLFFGSVAEEVVRNSKIPVMVLGPRALVHHRLPSKPKILVATDLTTASRRAEKFATALAKKLNAHITFFNSSWEAVKVVYETNVTGSPVFFMDDTIENMKQGSLNLIKRKTENLKKKGISCDFEVSDIALPLEETLLSKAIEGYSLIVMGTHSRNKFLKTFVGRSARKVIRNSPLPVFVVRS